MAKVVMRIKKGGEFTVEAQGIPGESCKLYTDPFEALGEVIESKDTDEMDQNEMEYVPLNGG